MIFTKKVIATCAAAIVVLLVVVSLTVKPNIVNAQVQIKPENMSASQLQVYQETLQQNYINDVDSLNSKFNMMISLLGVVIAVWIGINIYNLVDRVQIDNLTNKQSVLSESIENLKSEMTLLNTQKEELESIISNLSEGIDKLNDNYEKLEKKSIENVFGVILKD